MSTGKFALFCFLFFFGFANRCASAQRSAEVEKRVESILSKMTLEGKIDYIGGVDEFYIRTDSKIRSPCHQDG
jgi:hypothetical protein